MKDFCGQSFLTMFPLSSFCAIRMNSLGTMVPLLMEDTPVVATEPQSSNGASLDTPPGDTYQNAPLVNFVYKQSQDEMRAALKAVRQTLGQKYPLVIDGEKVWTTNTIASINPSNPDQVVGYQAHAEIPEAERAVVAAKKAFARWSRTPFEERAQLLERVAAIMERRRYELSALEVFEVGKAWAEADGDIREAMDFCLFYANQMRLIGRPRLTQHVPGEESYYHYWPRGIALVIAPWNFPLAILTGMVTAALVTGNTVIMKPAEQSAIIAAKLMEMFEEAGIPPGVLNLLTGKGSVIGAHLVDHKDIPMIAFTGSREVGLRIWKSAGETRPGQENSNASSAKWAARMPSSSIPTPTSTKRSSIRFTRRLVIRDKNVPPVRGSLFSKKITTA